MLCQIGANPQSQSPTLPTLPPPPHPVLTQSDDAQSLPSDPGRPRRHLLYLFHALDPGSFTEGLVQPGGSSVQVQDVAQRRIGRLLHGRCRHVAHCDACEVRGEEEESVKTLTKWTKGVKYKFDNEMSDQAPKDKIFVGYHNSYLCKICF